MTGRTLSIETLTKGPWLGGRVGAFEPLVGVQGSHGDGSLSPMLIK